MYCGIDLIKIRCNLCRHIYVLDGRVDTFVSKDKADDYAKADGWWIDGEEHYCPDCCEYDEDSDELIIKEGGEE